MCRQIQQQRGSQRYGKNSCKRGQKAKVAASVYIIGEKQ
jgi:hypothetical protein